MKSLPLSGTNDGERSKPRRRLKRDHPGELDVPRSPNQVWSMDFMSDQLASGKRFRTFNV